MLPLRIAWRYFSSKKTTNAINIIAQISMVAIAVVTAALMVVLSVFNGFEDLVISLYGDFYADIKIAPATGKFIPKTDSLLRLIATEPGVLQAEPIVQERAILIDDEDKSIVWLKGVADSYKVVSGVPKHIIRGEFTLGNTDQPALVLGSGVENALQVSAGRQLFPLSLYLPNRQSTQLSDPLDAMKSATAGAAGSFVIQQDFDNQYAFTNIGFMQRMLQLTAGQSTAIEVFTTPKTNTNALQKKLQAMLGNGFTIKTRLQQNQNLFAAMQAERLIIYAVAFLIMVIAAFNIISSLTMTVLEKQPDIGVLQAMGGNKKLISAVFLWLGILLAGFGGLIGFILGAAICFGQQHFHWVKLSGQSFLIDYYPVAMRWPDVFFVIGLIAIIAFCSGWLPSRKAANTPYSLKS